MDTANLLLIILLVIMIYLVMAISQNRPQSNVVYLPGFWGGQGPTWLGPRPGRWRPRFRRRFWW